jgi:hypothetical protein
VLPVVPDLLTEEARRDTEPELRYGHW